MSHGLAFVLMAQETSGRGIFWGLLVLLVISIASIAPAVVILVMLPATYFQVGHHSGSSMLGYHSALRWLARLAKNIFGLLLIVAGVFLSLPGIPGQGLLTILIGTLILDLPGKRRLERWLIGRPRILQTINRIRSRFSQPPLILDSENP